MAGIDSNAKLMLHFDNSAVDIQGHTVTLQGSTYSFNTTDKVFGSASVNFPGGDYNYFTVPQSSDFSFGIGDLTIDFRLKFISSHQVSFFDTRDAGVTAGYYAYWATNVVTFGIAQVSPATWSWTPNLAQWYHVAFVRSSGMIRFFVDGTEVSSAASLPQSCACANTFKGMMALNNSGWNGNTRVDEYRISNIARWVSDFIPPNAAYSIETAAPVTQLRGFQLRDSQISTAKLANFGVTTDKLQATAVTTAKINISAVTTAKLANNAVITTKIADSSVTTSKLVNNAIITGKLLSSNVTSSKLANTAVTTAKITDSNVTSSKLASSAVTSVKITNSSVTTAKQADSSTTTRKLANTAVTTAKLANQAVTTIKLANSGITTNKLANTAVTNAKIANGDITGQQIADSTITSVELADSAVITRKLANTAVTTAKLGNSSVATSKIADANVINVKLADSNVTTSKLANNAVTTVKITDSNVTTAKLNNGSVTIAKITASNVTGSKLADSNVTAGKLGTDSVTTGKILDSAVSTEKIANNAVTSPKINTSAVTTNKIANSNVTTAKLANSNVTTAKLANGAVSSAKFEATTITLQGLRVTGNSIFQGTTVFVQATNLAVRDNIITVGSGATGSSAVSVQSGLEVDRGSGTKAKVYFDENLNKWYIDKGQGVGGEELTTGTGLGSIITGETISRSAGTTITTFQLANTPMSNTTQLHFGGQRLRGGAGNDYTLTNSTVTLLGASLIGGQDIVIADYRY